MANEIANLIANLNLSLSWDAASADPLLGPNQNKGSIGYGQQFRTGLLASFPGNQMTATKYTVNPGSPVTVDLTAGVTNVQRVAGATFDRVAATILWLPSAAQLPSLITGPQASGVTIGKAGSNFMPAVRLHDSSSGLTLATGEARAWMTDGSAALNVTGTVKNLLLTNQDGTNAAIVVVIHVGWSAPAGTTDFSTGGNSMYVPLLF